MNPETEITHVVQQFMNFNDDLWDATSDMQPPLKQQWENWAKSCSNLTNMNAVIKIARSFMQRSFSEYNKDDYALNCANGVIDLKTGEIQEHKPEFFITQKTNVNLDPNGTCTNFLYFLDTIMDGNQELTEAERGKDAGNDEDKFWAKEIKNRQEDARKAVMKWRENGAIS